jgi:hypothetical protein
MISFYRDDTINPTALTAMLQLLADTEDGDVGDTVDGDEGSHANLRKKGCGSRETNVQTSKVGRSDHLQHAHPGPGDLNGAMKGDKVGGAP